MKLASTRVDSGGNAVEFETSVAHAAAEQGLKLYRGDFLAGVHLSGLVEFERWVEAERTHIAALP